MGDINGYVVLTESYERSAKLQWGVCLSILGPLCRYSFRFNGVPPEGNSQALLRQSTKERRRDVCSAMKLVSAK